MFEFKYVNKKILSFSGPLLRTIQMSSLYKDSKTFVDKKLKYPAGKIIKNFETLVNEQNGELLSLEQIKQVRIFSFEIYFYISLNYLFIE